MAESLLIRIPETGVDHAEWAVLDEKGNIAGDVMQSGLGEAAGQAGGRRVTVIASGEDVVLMEADVPAASAAQAKKAIPFALEESLASDVDELHFAIGKQTEDKRYPVAVVSREQMDRLKSQYEEAGLHPVAVVPESLAIPRNGGDDQSDWYAMLANGRTILRQRDFQGFAVESRSFSAMLDRALREAEDDAPGKLNLYRIGETEKPSLTIATASAQCESALEVFARGVASPSINLLQGDYSRRQQYGKVFKPWKMTGVLLILLLLVWGGSGLFEYIRLGEREAQLSRQIEDVYRKAFPEARNVPDPQKLMRQKLAQFGKGGSDFLATLGEITRAISAEKDLALLSVNYREGRLDLELDAGRLEMFDALIKRINAGGKLNATIQSANKQDSRVRARVRVLSR